MSRLSAREVRDFLTGQTLHAFDPATGDRVATVVYETGGICRMRTVTGNSDVGRYGLDGATYWTEYETFRDGTRNVFYLEHRAAGFVQAYFSDGRQAFLQGSSDTLPDAIMP